MVILQLKGISAMIVSGSSMSPYVRKVLAFAAEKGIEVESRPLGLGSEDPDFRAASPFRKIPAFRDGDFAFPIRAPSSLSGSR
jgi:glutathione S-transferase